MREIKFRGKCLDNGEWAVGDLLHRNDGSVYNSVRHFQRECKENGRNLITSPDKCKEFRRNLYTNGGIRPAISGGHPERPRRGGN